MEKLGLQDAVVGKLQSLLSQASALSHNFSSIIANCDSLREDVVAAHQSLQRDTTTVGPECDERVIARRKEFLQELSQALAALQESQELCSEIESKPGATKASHIVSRIILAVRANARALTCLEALSSRPYSDSGIACNARAQYRALMNIMCALIKRAPSYCISKSESPDILLGNDCFLLQGLHDSLLENAPEHVHVLVDAVTDDLSALFTDEVFRASIFITQEATSAGIFLRSTSLISSTATGINRGLDAFADSLGCVAVALRSAMPCSSNCSQHSLSNSIASALLHRAGQKLCSFAANSAGDFFLAQKWSEALQQLPPHAVASSEPAATFWDLWADQRSLNAVNATQQQLLQMNTPSYIRQCRNAKECVGIVF